MPRAAMKTVGYSGTPLHKKLGVRPGQRVWISGEPAGYAEAIQAEGKIEALRTLGKELDFIHFFTARRTDLERTFPKLRDAIHSAGTIWISWPKKSSGLASDLDENIVRDLGLSAGLVDVKVCAVDETWSGLKFVFRLRDR